MLRQATYGTIKFGTYYTLKSVAVERGLLTDAAGNERVWANVLCAVTAGAVSSAIATPTDVLKVRMQVDGRGTERRGLFGCFVQIYRLEGVRGLWRVSDGRLIGDVSDNGVFIMDVSHRVSDRPLSGRR